MIQLREIGRFSKMDESRFWRREKEGEEGKNGEAEVNAWILRLRILIATCTLRHVNEKKESVDPFEKP